MAISTTSGSSATLPMTMPNTTDNAEMTARGSAQGTLACIDQPLEPELLPDRHRRSVAGVPQAGGGGSQDAPCALRGAIVGLGRECYVRHEDAVPLLPSSAANALGPVEVFQAV